MRLGLEKIEQRAVLLCKGSIYRETTQRFRVKSSVKCGSIQLHAVNRRGKKVGTFRV